MKNKDYVIFLDMDGVLVDYCSGYHKTFGYDKELKNYPFDRENFWASLEWEYGGQELYNFAKETFENVHILSSTGVRGDIAKHKVVCNGKFRWIMQNIPYMPIANIHLVAGKEFKKRYAAPKSILVDDCRITVRDWISAGGIGIHHVYKHYQRTIYYLDKIDSLSSSLTEIALRIAK